MNGVPGERQVFAQFRNIIQESFEGGLRVFSKTLEKAGTSVDGLFREAFGILKGLGGVDNGSSAGALSRSAARFGATKASYIPQKANQQAALFLAAGRMGANNPEFKDLAADLAVAWFKNDIAPQIGIYGKQEVDKA